MEEGPDKDPSPVVMDGNDRKINFSAPYGLYFFITFAIYMLFDIIL